MLRYSVQPGDFVQAVILNGDPQHGLPMVIPGALVCVEAVTGGISSGPCSVCGGLGTGLRLTLDDPPAHVGLWRCLCAFQVVHRPNPAFIEQLLTAPVEPDPSEDQW